MIVSEDVGIANPFALLIVDVLEKQYIDAIEYKKDSSKLFLVHAVLELASVRKSRMMYNLLAVIYNEEKVRDS